MNHQQRPGARTRRDYFGWSGLVLGLLALGLLPSWIAPLYDPPSKPMPQRAVDWLGELKDKAASALRMEPPAPAPPGAPRRGVARSHESCVDFTGPGGRAHHSPQWT